MHLLLSTVTLVTLVTLLMLMLILILMIFCIVFICQLYPSMSHIITMGFQVPSYAFVTEHGDACDTVDVTYALFYPFNYGKVKIYLFIKIRQSCLSHKVFDL